MRRQSRYREVYEHFAALIDNGTMKPGDRLPTRPEIEKVWNVSHATATKAVCALRDDLYVRTNTSGTFVHLPHHDRVYQQLCNLLNVLEENGQDPHVMVSDGGIPVIHGRDGSVCWNPETEQWEKPTA